MHFHGIILKYGSQREGHFANEYHVEEPGRIPLDNFFMRSAERTAIIQLAALFQGDPIIFPGLEHSPRWKLGAKLSSRMFYLSLMVTINQKPRVDTQKTENESRSLWKIINSQMKTAREKERNNGTIRSPENNKMALVDPYLSIITLNVDILNSLI